MSANTYTTGRLRTLHGLLVDYGDKLSEEGSTATEVEVATILSVVEFALRHDQVHALARLLKPWMDSRLAGIVRAMALDEAERESAISAAREVGR